MSVRFMIDTDDLSKLTGHVELLATYSDLVPNPAELRKEFPDSTLILINRGLGDPSGEASVADIEPGALTVAQAVAWYDDAHARGVRYLTAYHDRDMAAEVAAGFGHRPHFNWDATLDGTAFIRGFDPLHSPAVIQVLSSVELDYHADGNLVYEDQWHPRATVNKLPGLHRDIETALEKSVNLTADLRGMAALLGG
jgi:hypothetical protein